MTLDSHPAVGLAAAQGVAAGPNGEAGSLPPAFEAWWQTVKEGWISRSVVTIRMLLGLPPGMQLVLGWPSNQSEGV